MANKYLYFDLECCDGVHICSFGYVLIDKDFHILAKDDILINPELPFKLGRAGFEPEIELSYPEEEFRKQENFKYHYPKIMEILCAEDTLLLGHSVRGDLTYIRIACERYGLEYPELIAYDTQKMYRLKIDSTVQNIGLKNAIDLLSIDISHLSEHKGCDDAEMTMLITKALCDKLNITLPTLLEESKDTIVNGKKKEPKPILKTKPEISIILKKIAEKYPDRFTKESICLSDTIEYKRLSGRVRLINRIFAKGYNFTNRVADSNYFVTGRKKGKREEALSSLPNKNKIKIINTMTLSKMLKARVSTTGELSHTKPTSRKKTPAKQTSRVINKDNKKTSKRKSNSKPNSKIFDMDKKN